MTTGVKICYICGIQLIVMEENGKALWSMSVRSKGFGGGMREPWASLDVVLSADKLENRCSMMLT